MRVVSGSIRWLYYRDVTGICFTTTALFLLLIFLLLRAEETAMFTDRQIVYDRCTLLSYRHSAGVLKSTFIDKLEQHGLLRYRGSRGGRATRTRRVISKLGQTVSIVEIPGAIPTMIGHRPVTTARPPPLSKCVARSATIKVCRSSASVCPNKTASLNNHRLPSLYVFNAASLAKPHAIENLSVELEYCNTDIAIISETHFKEKHITVQLVFVDICCIVETARNVEEVVWRFMYVHRFHHPCGTLRVTTQPMNYCG